MRITLAAVTGLALLATACLAPLTDPGNFQIRPTGPTTIRGSFQTVNGVVRYACPMNVTLSASGGNPGDIAILTALDWSFRNPNGTSTLQQDDDSVVSEMFGTTRLTNGSSISSVNYIVHSPAAQLTTTLNFHYEYAGAARTVAFTFVCT